MSRGEILTFAGQQEAAILRSRLKSRAATSNAKVGAIVMAATAIGMLILTHIAVPVAPLRILALGTAIFATWSLCDEMGMRKPLNRAGFIAFSIAVAGKIQLMLGITAELWGRYYLLYAAFLLLAVFFWSVALLHRPNAPKVVGALGAAASLTTILAMVIGHLAVGIGTIAGLQSILALTSGSPLQDLTAVTFVERLFGLWCFLAAWLLWRGHIIDLQPARTPQEL